MWDEAFYPLAAGAWTANRPGLTVGSLTNVFACPGLRLGYVICDEVEELSQMQPHWSVSSLALATFGDAPWVLVEAPGLRGDLAPHGVLVRDCASFGMEGTVRVAVSGPDDLERLEAALAKRRGAPTYRQPDDG